MSECQQTRYGNPNCPCQVCNPNRIEGWNDIRIYGMNTTQIRKLKEFYINETGDMYLEKL